MPVLKFMYPRTMCFLIYTRTYRLKLVLGDVRDVELFRKE